MVIEIMERDKVIEGEWVKGREEERKERGKRRESGTLGNTDT